MWLSECGVVKRTQKSNVVPLKKRLPRPENTLIRVT